MPLLMFILEQRYAPVPALRYALLPYAFAYLATRRRFATICRRDTLFAAAASFHDAAFD